MKDRERLKIRNRTEETVETRRLHAMWFPGLDLEQKEGLNRKTGEIQINMVFFLILKKMHP